MVALTCCIATSTILYTRYARDQWNVMRGQLTATNNQLTEMKEAGKQTDKLIEKAAVQAEATNSLAEQAKRSAKAAESNASAAQAAVNAAQKNLKLAERSLQIQERAWVGLSSANGIVDKAEGSLEPLKTKAIISNSGKTPAIDLSWTALFTLRGPPLPTEKINTDVSQPFAAQLFLLPGATVESGVYPFPLPDQISTFKSGVRLYFFGLIRYKDVFGKQHQTKFCTFWDPKASLYMYCPVFNSAD